MAISAIIALLYGCDGTGGTLEPMYRCPDADGGDEWQEEPCDAGVSDALPPP